MSNKNNHNPDNIYIVSVTNNKDKLHEEWDFISEKKQDKNNTVQCICNNDIYAEINIYKNNINNTTIFVGSGCKKKLELKNINNQKNILINKYKKRYKKLNIDNQTFKNIKDFNKYEEYVIKKICAIIVDELNKKMFTIKILYNLRNEINIIFENKKEYNNIFILINNLISKEEKRLEQEKLKQKRLEKERLEKERLEKKRLEKKRLKIKKIKQKRLEKKRLKKEKLEKEVNILIKEIDLKISSSINDLEKNIKKYKNHYKKNYKKNNKYNINHYDLLFDKINKYNLKGVSNYFKDFKEEEIFLKIENKINNSEF